MGVLEADDVVGDVGNRLGGVCVGVPRACSIFIFRKKRPITVLSPRAPLRLVPAIGPWRARQVMTDMTGALACRYLPVQRVQR